MSWLSRFGLILAAFLAPALASAHEVYVLTPQEITTGLTTAPFAMIATAFADLNQFLFWGFIAALTVFVVFFASVLRVVEDFFDPFLKRLRPYAASVARITVGIAFIASGYFGASYGPELPLAATFGAYAPAAAAFLIIIGLLTLAGVLVRLAAFSALTFFAVAVYFHGSYMLTYTNYLGEILALLMVGMHHGAWPKQVKSWSDKLAKAFAPYSFLILRVCFGVSLFYASFYAKILHNNLALQVASLPLAGHSMSIAQALGFEPHFLVLGAAIIEIVIALFFIFGIEIRFTSLFLLFWLSLSLWWFGEVVWPHLILIGIPIAFLCYGYDKYSLEGALMKRGGREPVL